MLGVPAAAGSLVDGGLHALDDGQERRRASRFVTVLGWVLIGLTGLAVASTLMQTMVFTLMLSMPDVQPRGPSAQLSTSVRTFLGLLLAFLVLTLASAVAFLKRVNWARRTFVLLFALAIAFNVGVLAALVSGVALPSGAPAAGSPLDVAARRMVVPLGVAAVVLSAVLAWLIRRLTSPAIRREFGPGATA
jgi:hypothetical protein